MPGHRRGRRCRPGRPPWPGGRGPCPRQRRPEAREVDLDRPSSRATAERSTTRPRPASPARRTESVRRSALRASVPSESGQSRAARPSRLVDAGPPPGTPTARRPCGCRRRPRGLDRDLDRAEKPDGHVGGRGLHPRNDTGGRPRTVTIWERSVRHPWSRWDRRPTMARLRSTRRSRDARLDGR